MGHFHTKQLPPNVSEADIAEEAKQYAVSPVHVEAWFNEGVSDPYFIIGRLDEICSKLHTSAKDGICGRFLDPIPLFTRQHMFGSNEIHIAKKPQLALTADGQRYFETLHSEMNQKEWTVVRNSGFLTVKGQDLLVGDVVILQESDIIPADGIIVECESAISVDKASLGSNEDLQLMSVRNPMLHMGCKVISGNCRMLVLCVGHSTKWGSQFSSHRAS